MINLPRCYTYLIELYYKNGLEYKLTDHKLANLTIIFAICCMKNDVEPFEIRLQEDGRLVNNLMPYAYVVGDIFNGKVKEDGNLIPVDCPEYKSLPRYESYCTEVPLTKEEKELLEKIFYKYGNYHGPALGFMLKQLAKEFHYSKNNGFYVLDSESVRKYFASSKPFKPDYKSYTENYSSGIMDYLLTEKEDIKTFINSTFLDKELYKKEFDKYKVLGAIYSNLFGSTYSTNEIIGKLTNLGISNFKIENCFIENNDSKYVDDDFLSITRDLDDFLSKVKAIRRKKK